jgi:AGCS family alanine or glycine:cation symporter
MAHAVAETDGPHQQGLWGMLEVFLATLVIATISALVIMTSGIYRSGDALRTLESGLIDPDMVGVPLVVQSFETVMGVWSGPFIAVCLTLFAISSILGWSYYGERCIEELLGSNRGKILYRMLFIALIMVGSVSEVELVWEIADLFNGLMALPNLIALLLLSPKVMEVWNANRKERLLRKRQLT